MLEERNRQDQLQSAIEQMNDLTQDAKKMRKDVVLDASDSVRFDRIPNGEVRVGRIASTLPQDYSDTKKVEADVPDGMTFGSREWVKYRISRDVTNYFTAQSVRSLEGLRSLCRASEGYRGKLDTQGIIGGTTVESCMDITQDTREEAHSLQVSFAAEAQIQDLSDTLASSFGVNDPGAIADTVDTAIQDARRQDEEIRAIASAEAGAAESDAKSYAYQKYLDGRSYAASVANQAERDAERSIEGHVNFDCWTSGGRAYIRLFGDTYRVSNDSVGGNC